MKPWKRLFNCRTNKPIDAVESCTCELVCKVGGRPLVSEKVHLFQYGDNIIMYSKEREHESIELDPLVNKR